LGAPLNNRLATDQITEPASRQVRDPRVSDAFYQAWPLKGDDADADATSVGIARDERGRAASATVSKTRTKPSSSCTRCSHG
jgi:hypothetical protein